MSNLCLTHLCLRRLLVSGKRWPPVVDHKRHLFGFFRKSKAPGVYILFPDIPSDTPETNELLVLPANDSTPTRFTRLSSEKCVKAVAKMSIDFDSCIDSLDQQLEQKKLSQSFDEVMAQIEERLVPLDYGMSTLRLLRAVDKQRYDFRHFDQFFNRITATKIRRFRSPQIYYFMRESDSNRDQLDGQQRRVVDKYLLEAKLFGTTLSAQESPILAQIHTNLAEEKTKYSENLAEATKRFSHTIDDPSLLGVLPDELIASIGSHSNATITLHSSVFNPFMEYCPDRSLRWNLWLAYNSRSSPSNDRRISNSIPIENIRALRRKQAQVLGYENYVELSLETKMARTVDNVRTFVSTLHTKSKHAFDANFKELTEFAEHSGSHESGAKLELWDLPYWQRKLLKSKYSIEDTRVKQYFPLSAVLNGMFRLAENLFDVKVEEVPTDRFESWHKDVLFFRILSPKQGIVGSFYLDPYARVNQKSRFSYNELSLNRCHSLQTKPISCLIANFAEPLISGQSTQLSFAQIISLFKQFGHILQHSLTESRYAEISGLASQEWDVVNFFPEFMALWPLNSYATLSSCSAHVSDGSPLPEQEFDKIRRAHYHFSSFDLKHEIYRMALDLGLYTGTEFWANIRDQVWDEYMSPFSRDKLDAHPCSFRAIFCDDFASAYFSFKWAEMLASDAFAAFQAVGVDDHKAVARVGARFKDSFLTHSGDYSSNEIFRRFLGRDPSPDAFLRINGIHGKDSHLKKDSILGNEKTANEGTAEKHVN
ncbi:unnamed protein product [Oppiella nova]|uniref:Peptidase M3A/M3B catalytic domain-containing protein n=1 Tax=Oppiella nova TaxID=334625 RepID=A0A7R9LTK4_9ACAR|nr:unnamed protein product [Oppiella nova]CAG2166855.1 unnamed protein product [Oppiella nova]